MAAEFGIGVQDVAGNKKRQLVYVDGVAVGEIYETEDGVWWTPLCDDALRTTELHDSIEDALNEIAARCGKDFSDIQLRSGAVNPVDESPDSHENPFWDTEEPGRLDTQDTAFPTVTDNNDPDGADMWAPRRRRQGSRVAVAQETLEEARDMLEEARRQLKAGEGPWVKSSERASAKWAQTGFQITNPYHGNKRAVRVVFYDFVSGGQRGTWDDRSGTITLWNVHSPDAWGTFRHELVHVVQNLIQQATDLPGPGGAPPGRRYAPADERDKSHAERDVEFYANLESLLASFQEHKETMQSVGVDTTPRSFLESRRVFNDPRVNLKDPEKQRKLLTEFMRHAASRVATPRGFELGDLTINDKNPSHELDDASRWSDSYSSENQFEDPNLKLGQFHVDPKDITLSYEEDENEFAFYAFFDDDILAGTVQGLIDEENGLARVTMSRVEEVFRNQGIGTRLYRAVLKWAGSKGLWVRPDVAVSDAARAVYHKLRKMPDVSHRPAPPDREILINEPPDEQGGEIGTWTPNESRPLFYEYRRARRTAQRDRAPVVCVDLDGTILGEPDYDTEEPSGQPGLAPPTEGAAVALKTFVDLGWDVIVHTARMSEARSEEQRKHMAEEIGQHLRGYDIPFTGIATGPKPVADHYIDDKAVPFNGDWWGVTKKLTVQGQRTRTQRLIQGHTKTAAYPPEDEDRLRQEVQWMADQLQTNIELCDDTDLKELWQELYDKLDDSKGYPEMARVTVHSPRVVETHTMDAAYCLYGAGSQGIRTPWCGNRSRNLYEQYGGGGLRRFLVLPTGPDDFVEIDGQRVPVADDAYTFAVDGKGQAHNVHDYENRYIGRGLNLEKGVQAAQILDETMGFNTSSFFESVSGGWEGFENPEAWTDNGFSHDEAVNWSAALNENASWTVQEETDRVQADVAKEFENAFGDLDRAAPWIEASIGNVDVSIEAERAGLTPAQLQSYWRADGSDSPLVEAFASMARMQVTPEEFRKNKFLLRGVEEEIAGEYMRFALDFPDSEVDPAWVAQDYKRRRKWVQKNPEGSDEWAEALDELPVGDAPQAYIQSLEKLGIQSPDVLEETYIDVERGVRHLRLMVALQKQNPEMSIDDLHIQAGRLPRDQVVQLLKQGSGFGVSPNPNDWTNSDEIAEDLEVNPYGGRDQLLLDAGVQDMQEAEDQ